MIQSSLEKAIGICGNQTALARKLVEWFEVKGEECRVKQGHVWHWINKLNGSVPSEYVIPIASATSWQVTPHELRPDLYPHPQDGLPEELRKAA